MRKYGKIQHAAGRRMTTAMRALAVVIGLLITLSTFGVPAKRGQWRLLPLANGQQVMAEVVGDEYGHFWRASDGRCFQPQGEIYRQVDTDTLLRGIHQRRQAASVRMQQLRQRNGGPKRSLGIKPTSTFQGKKKGIIILVEFSNKRFSTNYTKFPSQYKDARAFYDCLANQAGFNEKVWGFNDQNVRQRAQYKGSVHDYFTEQSGGQFDLTFDVVGPYTMTQPYSYYGKNGDANVRVLVKTACERAYADGVDFSQYDWDGDGNVDQVFILYAGHGQADYNNDDDDLIWPHEYEISPLRLGKATVSTYACSNEINGSGIPTGIGTFCHEFSHCMGFPDFYDTNYQNFGMGAWDLLDMGSYNGDGYQPAGYTAYEKMICGWVEPTVLSTTAASTAYTGIKPLAEMGQTFIVYNPNHNDEYYMLENRQPVGFDASLPGSGLLVTHVDYDEQIFGYNYVNNTSNSYFNDHQRMSILHANDFEDGDNAAYPYWENDSLCPTSKPATTLYHALKDGTTTLPIKLSAITQHDDQTMSFNFQGLDAGSSNGIRAISTDNKAPMEIYDLSGSKRSRLTKGVNIIRKDGKVRKVLVR